MLNDETKKIIEKFVHFKIQGIPIVFNKQVVSKTRWKEENALENKSSMEVLIRNFVRVKGCDVEHFSIKSLTLEDYLKVQEQNGIHKKHRDLFKQFIPFILEEEDVSEEEKIILERLYLKMPALNRDDNEARHKNFISRRDFLVLLHTAYTTCRPRTKLRYAIYLGLIGIIALRRKEAIQIQVGDFELDNQGLLKDIGSGYACLRIPKFKTKGGYSVNEKPFDLNYVVPNLRQLINTYLKSDFMKGYDKSTYLMRSKPVSVYDSVFDNVPNRKKDKLSYATWVLNARLIGSSIIEELNFRCKGQFESNVIGIVSGHDLRSSCNNWILKTPSDLDAATVLRSGELHLRHKKSGTVNLKHYMSDPSEGEFFKCIDGALNFPWDFDSLKKWEIARKVTHLEQFHPTISNNSILYDFLGEKVENGTKEKRIKEITEKILQLKKLQEENPNLSKIIFDAQINKLKKELGEIMEG